MTDHLFISGKWCAGEGGERPIVDPATGKVLGTLTLASEAQIDTALESAQQGFTIWSAMNPLDRSNILRRAAGILREEADEIGRILTQEQGKPLAQARGEVMLAAELFEWCAEEGRRLFGSIIPSRQSNVRHMVIPEPVGPVLAIASWNFPIFLCSRKLGDALAAGCSVVLKPAAEAPGAPACIVGALERAGLPAGVVSLLYGDSTLISERCIRSPIIKHITFTGSTPVGRKIGRLAAEELKGATMELGGHAPVLIFNDVDPEAVAAMSVPVKFRNAGQVCSSPTRFYVQDGIYDKFVQSFVKRATALRLGHGLDEGTEVGPLISPRRQEAMERLVTDAVQRGARLACGGQRVGNQGNFFAPTVLVDVPQDAEIMQDEPFGPVVPISRFSTLEDGIRLANDSPFGLCGYLFTESSVIERTVSDRLQVGVVAVNHLVAVAPEVPFGGIKESGLGTEGGQDGLRTFLRSKYVTSAAGSPRT
jgi:succinate-semialdehyde dehydrogenase/glutarate-semialdehyde dehydrogenase